MKQGRTLVVAVVVAGIATVWLIRQLRKRNFVVGDALKLVKKSEELRKEGNHQQAEGCCLEAVRVLELYIPKDEALANAYIVLALIYQGQGNYDQAQIIHRKAIDLYERVVPESVIL